MMSNRIDSTTSVLVNMFLNCRASDNTIIEYSQKKHKMCNKCKLIDTDENYKIFQFEFDSEKLQYKFGVECAPMKGVQKITEITFIGFCE
jgi:hypothetical protein